MRTERGIVFEVKTRSCIVATPDREFHEVPLPDRVPLVGEEIDINIRSRRRRGFFGLRYIGAAILVLALLAAPFAVPYLQGLAAPGQATAQPVVYLAMDVNPSIELGLDEAGMVLTVKGLNEDAVQLLGELELDGLSVDEAVQAVTAALIDNGFLTEGDENLVLMTITADDEIPDVGVDPEAIYNAVMVRLQESGMEGLVRLRIAEPQERDEACGLGLSVNRAELLELINSSAGTEALSEDDAAKLPLPALLRMLSPEELDTYFESIGHPGKHLGWLDKIERAKAKQAMARERFLERFQKRAEHGEMPPAAGPDGTPPGLSGDKAKGKPDSPPGLDKDK